MDDYLLCISDGEVCDADSYIQWALSLVAKAQETGHSKLLIDNRMFQLKLTQLDIITFANHLEEMGGAKMGFRLAVISSKENLDISRLAETAIINRSGVYKNFVCDEEAKSWLLKL